MSASAHYFDENNSYKIEFNIVDTETGAKISLSQLGTLQCTQFYYNPDLLTSDSKHLATINHRYNQDIKNANNVVVSTTGTVTWTVQPEDNIKLSTLQDSETELHIALFVWKYGNNKQNSHAFFNYVRRVPYISEF